MDDQDQDELELSCCAICGKMEGDSSNLTSQSTLETNAVPSCGHQFCEACLKREFARRGQFPCPTCDTQVKKANLTKRSRDAVLCENDTNWRRRVLKVYNKTQDDFADLRSYNDYLEEVEDIIYSIVNEEHNAEECKTKIKAYEEEHRAQIVQRQARKAEEERTIQDRIVKERQEAEQRKRDLEEVEREISNNKRRFKQQEKEFLLGQRAEISAELEQFSAEARQAGMQGYANFLKAQLEGRKAPAVRDPPRVRKPEGGLAEREPKVTDRTFYNRRRAAGGGIRTDDNDRETNQERQWKETVATLFERVTL